MRTSALAVNPTQRAEAADRVRPAYLEALVMIERLHRRLLDVIKDRLERHGREDISSTQALLLYNIGAREVTPSELRTRGYYLGSNASYNLKKLTADGFLENRRSTRDRRSVSIRLTEKGRGICGLVEQLYQVHVCSIAQVDAIGAGEFATLNRSLYHLERFWTDQIMYRL
jgi:DNA-binding MarR family transcriptional regulator